MNLTSTSPAFLVALALLAVTLGACGYGAPDVEIGQIVDDFTLQTLAGEDVRLSDYRGEVVLLDFWATWCLPCQEQARILEPVYEEYRDSGVEFLAVDVGEDRSTVERFLRDQAVDYPVLLDASGDVSAGLGVMVLPTVVLLDGQGEVVFSQAGVTSAREIRRQIHRAQG